MSKEFSTLGLVAKFANAWEAQGGTKADLNTLAESPEMIRQVLGVTRGQRTVPVSTRRRREKEYDDAITFKLPPTTGTSGADWIVRTEDKSNRVSDDAKQLLLSEDFQTTVGVVYKVVILRVGLFSDVDRTMCQIRARAKDLNLETPATEMACLIRERISDKALEKMGLWYITVMHEPIRGNDGGLRLLTVSREDDGNLLDSYYAYPDDKWYDNGGFAFCAPIGIQNQKLISG